MPEQSTTRRTRSAWDEVLLGSLWTDVLLMTAVVLAVTGLLLFTHSGFELDFTNHMWLASVAGRSLVEAGHPSYFLNTLNPDSGVFYPFFAFNGGTLYVTIGGLAELLGGHVVIAYVGVIVLAVAGAYGGTLWLGREFGLRGWLAHAPALVVVTSAYYITDLYGRGDVPELVAVSAIAPLAASAVHLIRTPRWRVLPVLAFTVSTVIFTGSHNITLLWGTTIAAGALLVIWLALGAPWRFPYRRLAMVAGLGVVSVMVNGWFLVTDVAYAHTTDASLPPNGPGQSIWPATGFFDTVSVVFNPLRTVPSQSGTPALYIQAPDWFLLWGIAAAALLLWRRSTGRALRRVWIGVAVVAAAVLGMLLIEPFWDIVGDPFYEIQFPYRLSSYLIYSVAGLVLLGALALQRAAESGSARNVVMGLRLTLVAACAVSLGLCLWQQWVPNPLVAESYTNRNQALVGIHTMPKSWYAPPQYVNRLEPVLIPPSERLLLVNPSEVHGDRFSAWMNVPPGPAPIQTDIGGSSDLVRLDGLRWLGRDPRGYAVLGRVNGGSGPVHVTIETAHNPVIALGRLLSILGVTAILAVLICISVRSRRAARAQALGRAGPLHYAVAAGPSDSEALSETVGPPIRTDSGGASTEGRPSSSSGEPQRQQ